MVIMAPVEMRVQALHERHLAAATGDEIVHIVYDVERVCPFIACAKKKRSVQYCISALPYTHRRNISAPSVHPLSGPAQLPFAFRASMNPVSSLKRLNAVVMDRLRRNSVIESGFPSSRART
jgi:hypothetical protein